MSTSMSMQLYILGPAFGLPSIDAECAAACLLLKLLYGNDSAVWTVTACHTSVHQLPLLIEDGMKISGFSNICHHLQTQRVKSQNSDLVALTALLQSRAPGLISAYLYVSYENYTTTTRPAFTKILPLYARFIIPPALRAAAKEATKQLGIGSIDAEAFDDKHGTSAQSFSSAELTFEAEARNRGSLLLPKSKTVRGLLAQRPEHAAAFKLRSLADALLEPLADLLGGKEYFGEDEVGSVDCLVYAYLSLMLKPNMPQSWLKKILTDHYPGLVQYVARVETALGISASTVDESYPWTPAQVVEVAGVATTVATAIQNQLSILRPAAIDRTEPEATSLSRNLSSILLLLGSVVVAATSWTALPLLTAQHGDPVQIFGRHRPSDFGHLSDALAGLSFGIPYTNDPQPHVVSENEAPARVGIEIES